MEPATVLLVLVGAVALVVIAWCIGAYNRLIRVRNAVSESWADVTTELKRRYDLIPNLVDTVKGYVKHEREIMEAVTRAHEVAMAGGGDANEQADRENQLSRALKSLIALGESYPELRASANFVELQKELANTEDRIQAARRFFNANVRDNNNAVQYFPNSIIAGMAGFKTKAFFEIDDEAIHAPVKVSFD